MTPSGGRHAAAAGRHACCGRMFCVSCCSSSFTLTRSRMRCACGGLRAAAQAHHRAAWGRRHAVLQHAGRGVGTRVRLLYRAVVRTRARSRVHTHVCTPERDSCGAACLTHAWPPRPAVTSCRRNWTAWSAPCGLCPRSWWAAARRRPCRLPRRLRRLRRRSARSSATWCRSWARCACSWCSTTPRSSRRAAALHTQADAHPRLHAYRHAQPTHTHHTHAYPALGRSRNQADARRAAALAHRRL
jgi:hypothetical protein